MSILFALYEWIFKLHCMDVLVINTGYCASIYLGREEVEEQQLPSTPPPIVIDSLYIVALQDKILRFTSEWAMPLF